MIKNFFVKVKPVKSEKKGMLNLLRYLVDKKRHPDGIINFKKISNVDKYFLNLNNNITNYNIHKKLNGIKGRSFSSWGDSYIFSFPKDIKIENNEQYKKIINELLLELYNQFLKQLIETNKDYYINFNNFVDNIFLNIHTNKHIHINIIFSKVLPIYNKNENKTMLYSNRITNRKRFLSVSKGIFNKIILNNFDLNINDYKPKTNFKKGYKSIYIKEQMNDLDKKITELKQLKSELKEKEKELDDYIKMKRSERKKEIGKLVEENEKREEIVNNFYLVVRYYNSFMKKQQNNEIKGIVKDYNLIMEKVNKLEQLTNNKTIRKITNEIKQNTKYKYKIKM